MAQKRVYTVFGFIALVSCLAAAHPGATQGKEPLAASETKLAKIPGCEYELRGWIGSYVRNVTQHWLTVAPQSNPGLLEMLRDRDRKPLRGFWGHEGEYPGKYLTGAVEMLRLTRDEELRRVLEEFVRTLISYQASDGYLGPWPEGSRLTGSAPNIVRSKSTPQYHGPGITLDGWGHYHLMVALMLWHEETGDEAALECVRKIADLMCRMFLDTERRMLDMGVTHNLSPIHALVILYQKTGEERYLKLALEITKDLAHTSPIGRPAGNYIKDALAGKELYQTSSTRWEITHVLMGIGELYWATGDELYRRVLEHYWWSMVKLERHNNGGMTTDEAFRGNPYDPGAIETCSTIAWIAMSVQMLRMTANSIVADEIELSTLNSVAGLYSPTGRWVTYNTPMDGVRNLFKMHHNWQALRGTAEFNCCSANAPRGFGQISDWAIMQDKDGVVLNYYGPSKFRATIRPGLPVTFTQQTDYPRSGRIQLMVSPHQADRFTLKLRIPYWSQKTEVKVNGQSIVDVQPGQYLRLERRWEPGDQVELELDMSPHFWVGEQECEGKVSMYRGPILMTYDRRYNDFPLVDEHLPDPATVGGEESERDVNHVIDDIPELDASTLTGQLVECKDWLPPMMLVQYEAKDGQKVHLCDFASAGATRTPYKSWLEIKGAEKVPFSRFNPLRSGRVRR